MIMISTTTIAIVVVEIIIKVEEVFNLPGVKLDVQEKQDTGCLEVDARGEEEDLGIGDKEEEEEEKEEK